MAVQVEPPRWRPRSPEPARYPGLTPEERGYERPPPEPAEVGTLPGTPLWIAPSELPPPARSVGFVVASEAPPTIPAPETEGLFDVPGLLERLWLARALESRRSPSLPVTHLLGPGPVAEIEPVPSAGELTRPDPEARPPASPAPPAGTAGPELILHPAERAPEPAVPPPVASWPSSWVCPYCYLANDPRAATCRGCRSCSLHL